MKEKDIERLMAYLSNLSEAQFYGKVMIVFQNGLVDTIKTESLHRLDSLPIPTGSQCPDRVTNS